MHVAEGYISKFTSIFKTINFNNFCTYIGNPSFSVKLLIQKIDLENFLLARWLIFAKLDLVIPWQVTGELQKMVDGLEMVDINIRTSLESSKQLLKEHNQFL